jgi:uncharacterized protein
MNSKKPFHTSRLRRWFIGHAGIRAGLRVLMFAILLYSFEKLLGTLERAIPFFAEPLRPVSDNLTASGLLVKEIRNVASAALAAVLMMRIERKHHSFSSYGLPFGEALGLRFWKGVALGLGGALLLFLLLRLEGVFLFGPVNLTGSAIFRYAAGWAAACFLVGVYEEFVFRGYLLQTLRHGMGFWGAALLSSLLFGLIHLGNGNDPWYIVLSAATFGMLYSLSVIRTGTLWFAIGVHAAFDFSETFLFSPSGGLGVTGHLLDSSLHGPVWLTGGVAGPEASVNGVLVFALLFLIVNRLRGANAQAGPTKITGPV